MAKNPGYILNRGFTLVELLVVIGIIGILMLVFFGFVNPYNQFAKADDARRQNDLTQLRTALDAYFNDTGCYPTALNFGSPLTNPGNASTIYIKKIPQDPTCGSSGAVNSCYQYLTDTSSSCPQWNVLVASLRATYVNTREETLCPLETLDQNGQSQGGCLPAYYKPGGYNFCLVSGTVDCSVVVQEFPVTPTPVPTILLNPATSCTKIYACNSISPQFPKGICNLAGTDQNGNGLGTYCGYPLCHGNACCDYNCTE